MIWTGSPGSRCSEKNTSTATPSATGTASSTLRTILNQRILAPALVPRLLQQVPRLRGIVRIGLERGIVAEAARQERRREPRAVAVIDVAQNRRPLDGIVDPLPQPRIVEGLRLRVELDLVGPRAGGGFYLHVRVRLEAIHKIRRHFLDDLHLAGEQRRNSAGRLRHHPE